MAALKTHFDYTLVNGVAQILYLGQAEEWIADNDPRWTIKKFTWIIADDNSTQLSEVQVLTEVAWTNRASLNWS